MCKAWDDQFEYGKKEGLIISVRNLMETMHFSMEKAMKVLKVPVEEQAEIAQMLQKA